MCHSLQMILPTDSADSPTPLHSEHRSSSTAPPPVQRSYPTPSLPSALPRSQPPSSPRLANNSPRSVHTTHLCKSSQPCALSREQEPTWRAWPCPLGGEGVSCSSRIHGAGCLSITRCWLAESWCYAGTRRRRGTLRRSLSVFWSNLCLLMQPSRQRTGSPCHHV